MEKAKRLAAINKLRLQLNRLQEMFLRIRSEEELLDAVSEGGCVLYEAAKKGIGKYPQPVTPDHDLYEEVLAWRKQVEVEHDKILKEFGGCRVLGPDYRSTFQKISDALNGTCSTWYIDFLYRDFFIDIVSAFSNRQRLLLRNSEETASGYDTGSSYFDLPNGDKGPLNWSKDFAAQGYRFSLFMSELLSQLEEKTPVEQPPIDDAGGSACTDGVYRSDALLIWDGIRYEWLTDTMMDALELLVKRYPGRVTPSEMQNRIGRLPEGGFKKVFKFNRGGKTGMHPVVSLIIGRHPQGWSLTK